MHGFCGILSLESDLIDKNTFIKSINLADTMQVDSVTEKNFFSAVSFLDNAPLKGQRIFKTNDLIILFTGDLIEQKEIPWKEIEANYLNSNFKWFSTLRGLFAIVVFNKKLKQISLISDHRAQIPVYYGIFENSFIFSTDLSTFTTLKTVPDFNVEWLYEYMFFNFPIDRTTFLKNVERLRPISLITFDLASKNIKELKYGEYFKVADSILTGKEALDKSIKFFKERIPKYYCKDKTNLVAISGGFDSRTILSLAPEKSNVETYTYGVEGSGDLETVSTFINKLDIDHQEILFDEMFKKSLPNLIYDTVRLSGGIQPILRSTLSHVYKTLYKNNKDVSVVMGGLAGDFYRGWDINSMANTSVSSYGMKFYFQKGETVINKKKYPIADHTFEDFENHIQNSLKKIKILYGDPISAQAKMSFTAYEVEPNYFGGEIAIASNYFTVRQPFYDIDLMNLAYKTDCSQIGYLKRLKEKKDVTFKQYILQTKVIASNTKFKSTYIHGLPITLFTYGNKSLLKVSRLFIRGFAYLKGYRTPKNDLEEWEDWFGNNLHKELDNLLNDRSLLLKYINKDFIISAKKSNDIHLLSKFATTEIILNLIKNRWDI